MAAASNANVSTNANVPAPKPIEDMSIEEIIEISKAKSKEEKFISAIVKNTGNSRKTPYQHIDDIIDTFNHLTEILNENGFDPKIYKSSLEYYIPYLYYWLSQIDDINKKFKYNYLEASLLGRAIRGRQEDIIKILMSEGADISIEEIIEISKAKSVDPIAIKNTVDHYMVSKRHINSLINSPNVKMNDKEYKRLISQIPYELVANIIFEISDIRDDPAKYKPTLLRTLPGLYYLFRNYDIDIDKRFKYKGVELSLLERAKESNQKDIIKILIYETIIVTVNGVQKLKWDEFTKIYRNPDKFIDKLTPETVNLTFDKKDVTPLVALFIYGSMVVHEPRRYKLVSELLQKGADVNLGDPLKLAIQYMDYESAELLLVAGADYTSDAAEEFNQLKTSVSPDLQEFARAIEALINRHIKNTSMRRRGNILRGYELGEMGSIKNSKTGGRRKRSTRRHQRRTRSKTHHKRRQTRRKK